MFDKEACLIEKNKVLEKKKKKRLLLKVAYFFPKFFLNQTHVELIDDKSFYGTVD